VDLVFVIDEIATLQPAHDSSVAIMEAAQLRGHRVLVTTAAELGFTGAHVTALARPVRLHPAVLHDGRWLTDPQWFSLGPAERYRLNDAAAMLQRNSPA
jgi:glutathione synthase